MEIIDCRLTGGSANVVICGCRLTGGSALVVIIGCILLEVIGTGVALSMVRMLLAP